MIVRTLAALAVAATALGVAACSGDPSPNGSAGDREAQTRRALLDYARCMREHGIDMPDPQFSSNGGKVRIRVGSRNEKPSDQTLRTAQAACKHFQEQIKPPNLSDQDKEQHRQEALAYSRCMREHGIDFPDPQFSSDGGMKLSLNSARVHPDSPAFKAADQACASKRPGGGGPATTDVAP